MHTGEAENSVLNRVIEAECLKSWKSPTFAVSTWGATIGYSVHKAGLLGTPNLTYKEPESPPPPERWGPLIHDESLSNGYGISEWGSKKQEDFSS